MTVGNCQRNRKVSLEELCAGWNEERVGEEWGGSDVGAEIVDFDDVREGKIVGSDGHQSSEGQPHNFGIE